MSHLSGAPLGERRYLVPQGSQQQQQPMGYHGALAGPPASEDLHAWSIYRQNLNSDFTDSALGSSDKSPLPYGNFQLRDTTVQSILSHPRYGPKSALGSNMYTYLKFGLPRVFPPNHSGVHDSQRSRVQQRLHQRPSTRGRVNRGYVDGSSGYDSSDNETNHQIKMQRKYRSDPDFLSQGLNRPYNKSYLGTGIPLVALQQAASRVSIAAPSGYHSRQITALRSNRSVSEANLLSPSGPNHSQRKRGSRKNSMIDEGGLENEFEKHSRKAESILSGTHVASMRDYGASIHGMREGVPYPNLQCLNLEIPCNPLSLIGVSLQARAGDLIAVMATVENQGTALLEGIAGVRKRLAGDILLNGQHVNINALRSRVAWSPYREKPLYPFITVFSTLTYYSQLKYPLRGKSDINDRINILIEELGLEQVREMAVSRLTDSEIQRLSVACQLLQDTAILVLDQPTKGMDIFDTFFLVEYLRQYASSGCIVILTLQPPTSEIFSMCTAVVLLSSGRVMYSGYRGGFVDHFTRVGYPCPPYKNPSDYYLDLVTLDDLSAAAMLESSGRIESLAENWMSIGVPSLLTDPPASLPDAVVKPNVIVQALILFRVFLIYSQPHTVLCWAFRVFLAALISVIIGATFWDLPSSDPQLILNDRLGYHYAVNVVCIWPILLCLVYEDLKHIHYIERDIKMGLYGRFTYIFVKMLISIPACIIVWLAYLVPSHSMTGLFAYQKQNANFYDGVYHYIGFMLLYLMVIQIFLTFLAYTVKHKMYSILLGGLIFALIIIPNGYIIHSDDVTSYLKWLEYISPLKWILPIITAEEFSEATISRTSSTLLCRNKQHQDIIIQQLCPPPNGTNVQATFNLLPRDHVLDHMNMTEITLIALVATYLVFLIFIFISFISNCASMCYSKRKSNKTSI